MKRLLGMVLLVVASAGLLTGVTVTERGMAYFSSEVVFYPFGEGVLATMPNGRIYHLWIFDKDLEELRNFDLRRGEGPGDVKIIKGIVADGERVYVWDDGPRRISIFTRDWKFVEFKPVPSLTRALLLEKVDHGFVFKWGDFSAHKGKKLMRDCVGVWDGAQKRRVVDLKGPWVVKGKYNDTRDHLVSCFFDRRFYTTPNTDYNISVYKADGAKFVKTGSFGREIKTSAWNRQCETLIRELLPQTFEAEFPDNVPPVFDILANDTYVAVLTNEALPQRETSIDFWQKGQYKGTVKIPIIYGQRFIFPSPIHLPGGVYLRGDILWSLHYVEKEDAFYIVKRTIQF